MINDILNIIIIGTEEQVNNLANHKTELSYGFTYDVIAAYPIKNYNSDYYCAQVELTTFGVSSEGLISYLLSKIDYICFRTEGSPFIFVKNLDDLEDLKEDCYNYTGAEDELKKDLLTMQERHDFIFEIETHLDLWAELILHFIHNGKSYAASLDPDTIELFTDDSVYEIEDATTGEMYKVDLTTGMPEDYFSFVVEKNLDKNHKNIL